MSQRLAYLSWLRWLEMDKVNDVQFESEFGSIIRELIAAGKGSSNYFTRLALAD